MQTVRNAGSNRKDAFPHDSGPFASVLDAHNAQTRGGGPQISPPRVHTHVSSRGEACWQGQLPQLESEIFAETVQMAHKNFFLGELGVNKCKSQPKIFFLHLLKTVTNDKSTNLDQILTNLKNKFVNLTRIC